MEGGSCHVVAMPYPGRGHINPMLNLCKRLSSKRPDVHVTFVVTEEWLGLLLPAVANVHYATIPNVIPSEVGRAKDILGFLEAVRTNMEAPFEDLLDGLPSPPDVIVFDTYLEWVTGVGSRRGVPVASLWTQSATVLSLFYHFELVKQHRHFPLHVSEHNHCRRPIIYAEPSPSSTHHLRQTITVADPSSLPNHHYRRPTINIGTTLI